MFGFAVGSPKVAVVRSQYVQDVIPARTLAVDIDAILILFRPCRQPEPAPQNCISQMKRLILGTYWITWSQQRPLSRNAPLESFDGPLGQIVVGSTDLNVLPLSVEMAPNVFAVASTVPLPSAPLMSGGAPENETWGLKLVFFVKVTEAAPRPAAANARLRATRTTTGFDVGLKLPRVGPRGTFRPLSSL